MYCERRCHCDGGVAIVDYDAIDPELRRIARLRPKGYGLQRGPRVPRALMGLTGRISAVRGVEVASGNPGVTVRVHRQSKE
ncbi:hypothetical protein [Mycobacterium asiaticum]|uniref:Uncharacterized protein n=1 Tax=Mycobacterium asiaticum TaxID=1790 RepID=A0A1A3KRX8_MYCAS|nr:hypothetical protein [Mycobacterium asiaticum]OBJ51186.1 hypothetical protein A9W94_26835 [Mycobacterium asiaticum]OBJ87133.1 hypothetical protein A5640_07560 [Mycobacterium asiaticum]